MIKQFKRVYHDTCVFRMTSLRASFTALGDFHLQLMKDKGNIRSACSTFTLNHSLLSNWFYAGPLGCWQSSNLLFSQVLYTKLTTLHYTTPADMHKSNGKQSFAYKGHAMTATMDPHSPTVLQ